MVGGASPVRAGVLGSPIGHSLSPVLHRAAYAELGLAWTYDSYDVTEEQLPAFLAGLTPDWAGLSLTMPLKKAVLPLLDGVGATARTVQAVNTVIPSRGRLLGTNTDVPGMVAALTAAGVDPADHATVLGGGATAASALAALAQFGVSRATAVVRRPGAVDALRAVAERLGQDLQVCAWSDGAPALTAPVVVSTVPGGAADDLAEAVPEGAGVLFDVAYDPWPTALATAWLDRGAPVLDGLHLLVHQAVLQVALMTGRGPLEVQRLVPVLDEAGRSALAER